MLTNELTQEVVVAQPELCLEGRRLRSIWALADDALWDGDQSQGHREKWAAFKAHQADCMQCAQAVGRG